MPSTKSGANIVLVKDGKILLLLRGKGSRWKPNHWGPPGGHVEPTETSKQAAIRETFEESGLTVEPGDLKLLLQRSKNDFGMIYLFITNKHSGDEVVLSDEHDDFIWVDMEEMKDYDTIFELYEINLIKKAILSI